MVRWEQAAPQVCSSASGQAGAPGAWETSGSSREFLVYDWPARIQAELNDWQNGGTHARVPPRGMACVTIHRFPWRSWS
jgi:hypothetical protein